MSCGRCGGQGGQDGGGGTRPPTETSPGSDGMERLQPTRVVDSGEVEDPGPTLDPRMLIFVVLVAWAGWSELAG